MNNTFQKMLLDRPRFPNLSLLDRHSRSPKNLSSPTSGTYQLLKMIARGSPRVNFFPNITRFGRTNRQWAWLLKA
ncbi:MAG: hypothetical protein F6K09_26250 [Merismopedia sp. SIO2A8]|nr:hypothetical protein [Merismopedia sp. SIO2A8]